MFTEQEIDKLAELSRIALSQEEKQKFQRDFESILGYISELKNAPVADRKLSADDHYLTNVMREDNEAFMAGANTAKILAEAPKSDDNFFVVKQILDHGEDN
ncbi:MAG: hypothetical protein A2607_00980 [Candidatus Vogelbacteria bacterium RIFOXYD1_FULL_42_15]|uniref:Aspartyl/glutamyl-tRNA(Asn/Gln) amidotransferase subunit C n=1 Tax=Candidatus Vogelbacteria bacterium RIFOXYD1_FULL_42_15 TaxID=1802437 RepID=A0A1G2QDC0_9BACT|nr:MAG: hypothetical protein A2607_00980 [Candidatus Vogelbacteria bacterium RIFOXYD1_FULL_42_15]